MSSGLGIIPFVFPLFPVALFQKIVEDDNLEKSPQIKNAFGNKLPKGVFEYNPRNAANIGFRL